MSKSKPFADLFMKMNEGTVVANVAPVTGVLGYGSKTDPIVRQNKKIANIKNIPVNEEFSYNDIVGLMKSNKIKVKSVHPTKNDITVEFFNDNDSKKAQKIIDSFLFDEDVIFKSDRDDSILKYSTK